MACAKWSAWLEAPSAVCPCHLTCAAASWIHSRHTRSPDYIRKYEDMAHRAMTERSMSEAEIYDVDRSRRTFLITGISLAAAGSVPIAALAATEKTNAAAVAHFTEGRQTMSTITTKDGAEIFYKDWGKGQPIVFSHGWPLTADDWDAQMMFFLNHGYRVIAHDRRGHGRSSQRADGHDMDHY